ncbi:alginate o-acetyltransferase AlgJ [Asticcacaulis biprosthecium C19]|uniref:Alginate o-acetyltransferase AlgJ n=1 Tax=Asticcacaulis biprosthecium C19 TaxID=715226 RepID=F4QM14_9CAUL|nr:alginate o-acetyltransferase AlgJ [Asticcacaulis biprosthecium]EGF93586.1 alginate o-acetyltransferase AlgJ [Asticcacaulis biprosthecium C19]
MKVLEGKDGFLFLDNDSNGVLSQHTGKTLLSEGSRAQWRETLALRAQKLAEVGLRLYFVVPPDNHAICPEKLPDSVVPAAERPVHQIKAIADSIDNITFVYPLPEIQAEKRNQLMVCTTDSHWSHAAAYVAYRTVMAELAKARPDIRILDWVDITFDERDFLGDLGSKLAPQVTGRTVYGKVTAPRAKQVSDNKVVNRGNIVVYEQPDAGLPSAVMFRDSYGLWLSPFLAQSFRRLVVIASPVYEHDYILEEKPDFVLMELSERFLIRPPNDLTDPTTRALIAAKVAQAGS